MVVSADDVGDAHLAVVDHGGEVVGGRPVAAEDHHVVELFGVEGARAVHHVVHHDGAVVVGHAKAPHVGLAGIDAPLGLLGVEVAAGALIALERVAALLGGRARGLELLGGAEAGVGAAGVDELLKGRPVVVAALGLVVGAAAAAHAGALVPVEAEPGEGPQDLLGVLLGRTARVGVVDAQHEGSARAAGERPVVNCRAGSADVQLPGGGGCKADADGFRHDGSNRRCATGGRGPLVECAEEYKAARAAWGVAGRPCAG